MLYKYELVCKEAGVEEEKVKELRRMFDAEYKKLKRRKEARRKSGLGFYLLSDLADEDEKRMYYLIKDPEEDVEAEVFDNICLEQLREELAKLPADDRDFLLDLYGGPRGTLERIAKEKGIPHSTLIYRREKLLRHLRKKLS